MVISKVVFGCYQYAVLTATTLPRVNATTLVADISEAVLQFMDVSKNFIINEIAISGLIIFII